MVTQLTPGSKKSIAPSLPVKKNWSVKPFWSWLLEMVVGFPGEPVGSCSDQIESLKLHPGGTFGLSGPLP